MTRTQPWLEAVSRMGPPPRSLTAEANSCFMVRVPHGLNRIQGCGASIAPERGLPSDQLYRTSNNEGDRVAVTLDTKVLIQGCVKTCTNRECAELFSLFLLSTVTARAVLFLFNVIETNFLLVSSTCWQQFASFHDVDGGQFRGLVPDP